MIRVIGFPACEPHLRNPYTRLLYQHMEAKADVRGFSYRRWPDGSAQILHVHWPERELNDTKNPLVALGRLRLKLFYFDRWRARGAKLVWTVHNLHSHTRLHPRIEQWFWPRLTRRLDAVIVLNQTSLELARSTHPWLKNLPAFIVPHGHYREVYPFGDGRDHHRELGLDPESKVILFFGNVEPYKNLPVLIAAFQQMRKEGKRTLLIAGRPGSEEVERQLQDLAAGDPNIRLHMRYVRNEDAQLYFRAASLVALPFSEILNSGSLLLALSMNRPVLAPERGAIPELAARFGPQWVRTYAGELTPRILAEALEWAVFEPRPEEAPLDGLDWNTVSTKTLAVYRQVIEQGHAQLAR